MRAHVIENGVIVNTIEVDSLDLMPDLVEATDGGIGWSYADGVFTPPETPGIENSKADDARRLRNRLLSQSDWTQASDSPVDKTAWAAYRQALRDIPEQSGFPDNIDWPTPL